MKSIIIKIKEIINRFNPLIYTRVIKELVKDVKLLRSNYINEVATLKEHIKSVETLVNELCELNQINEGNKDD